LRQETFTKWTERDEADAELFKRWHHRLFRLSPEQRILALECGDGLHCVRAPDRFALASGKPKCFTLPSWMSSFTAAATSSIGTHRSRG
jgi:hypothetical protein